MTTDVPRAYFLGGTLVLEGVDRLLAPPVPFQWLNARWRCPAVHYRTVCPWLAEHDIRNAIPRWSDVSLVLHDDRELHAYQIEAIQARLVADRWGNIVSMLGWAKVFSLVVPERWRATQTGHAAA